MKDIVTDAAARPDPVPAAVPAAPAPARGPAVRRIVVGVDDSPSGLSALRWATARARASGAPLVAVRSWALGLPRHGGRRHRALAHPHVVLRFDGFEQLEKSAEIVRRSFRLAVGGLPRDVTVTVMTPEGDPGTTLTGIASDDGDLLAVGREPALSLRQLLHGSVSRYCSGHARCPVAVIPAADAPRPDARDAS
ncbi:MAG TPA: universal stress protein [Streptosporangiaceae bacterium]|nr:universal stress protein [Streptosporangiaceae bacterium]